MAYSKKLIIGIQAVAILFLTLQECSCQSTTGKVFVLGGATDDNSATIYNALREATGKSQPNIVVAISAAPSLTDGLAAYNVSDPGSLSYRQLFLNYGFSPAVLYLAIDNYREGSTANTTLGASNIAEVERADVIFFNGGDQSRHSRSWLNDDGSDSDIMEALRIRFAEAAVIAGTSAGCAIQSDPMYGSGISYGYYYFNADLKNAMIGEELLDDRDGPNAYRASVNGAFMKGFGFLQDILLDSHFDARGRFGRLAVAMKQSNISYGFGVDEDSAVYIFNGTATVYGTYGAWLIDSSSATFPNETYFAGNGFKVAYLSENDTYTFASKTVTSAKPLITIESGVAYESSNIFVTDEAYKSITTLVSSTSNFSIGVSKDKKPTTRVAFYKSLETHGYYDGLYTIDSLWMDIGTD